MSTIGNPYFVCCYGSWSDGQERFVYKSYDDGGKLSHEELREIQIKESERKKQLEIQLREDRAKRIEVAKELWEGSIENPTTARQKSYLERKQVNAYGIKYGFDAQNLPVTVIPIRNSEGEIQAIQYIHENGSKRIHGVKKGNFHTIGVIAESDPIYITEGYATGASVHEATKSPVVIAVDCGNLYSVISNLRAQYPNNKLIIAADDDVETLGNPGKTKAEEAAKVYGCKVVVPVFPQDFKLNGKMPTDFNDLHVHFGLEQVCHQLEQKKSFLVVVSFEELLQKQIPPRKLLLDP